MKCPICQVPVNTKDSLEDKLLKELLLQLKKLKNIIENDSKDQCLTSKGPEIMEENMEIQTVKENLVPKESATETFKEKLLDKADAEIISPTAPNFSCSTPKVRRKKKILPKSKPTRQSTGEGSGIQVYICFRNYFYKNGSCMTLLEPRTRNYVKSHSFCSLTKL